MDVHSISTHCTRTEFVGTAVLDTHWPGDFRDRRHLIKEMKVGTDYHALACSVPAPEQPDRSLPIDDAVKGHQHRSSLHRISQRHPKAGADMETIL